MLWRFNENLGPGLPKPMIALIFCVMIEIVVKVMNENSKCIVKILMTVDYDNCVQIKICDYPLVVSAAKRNRIHAVSLI